MKQNSIVLLGLIIVSIMAAFGVRNYFFEKSNITNYMELKTLQNERMIVESYSSEEDFSEEDLRNFIRDESEMAMQREYIFEVIPTGKLYINNSVIMQEVSVLNTIKGTCEYEKIWIRSEGCTIARKDENAFGYIGLDYSLMQQENTYLVFCVPSEINQHSDKKIYNTDDSLWFPYYNITKNSENVMKSRYYDKEIEFYTDSEVILNSFYQLKNEIFERLEEIKQ